MASPARSPLRRFGEAGIVGANLVVTIAFALYAVIMLSRVTLAAKQIDDRVRVILGEVGPGTNVSRLDETVILDTVGDTAEKILAAARPLSGQAGQIIDIVDSIDNTVSGINANAAEINSTVKSINGSLSAALPVVRNINGDNTINAITGGVAAINMRADIAKPIVGGISDDLGRTLGQVGSGRNHPGNDIHSHVNSINCSSPAALGDLLGPILSILLPGDPGIPGCDQF